MKSFLTLIIFITLVNTSHSLDSIPDKVCNGTNYGLLPIANFTNHYRELRDSYINCTYVNGNLEITWIPSILGIDPSFLENIREVTGYFLINRVDLYEVALPQLRIIHGKTLFKKQVHDRGFALFVTLSKIFTLEMPALREIINGDVGIHNNYNLCHVKTINWNEIISGHGNSYSYIYNFTSPDRLCPECKNCLEGCWGDGSENCQRFSKVICSSQCSQSRCFTPSTYDCCHLNCVGGCTGPKSSDCYACRHVKDVDECVSTCPPHKVAYAGKCVTSYPLENKADNGIRVSNSTSSRSKTCKIEADSSILNSGNIDNFKGCTVLEGSLLISVSTFNGYQQVYTNFSFGPRFVRMHPDKLEVFSTVKQITGYLNVQGDHPDFKNLSYFRNLEIIGGNSLTDYYSSSLYIGKSSLASLGLRSLKKIASGSVTITNNKNLCYVSTLDWKTMQLSTGYDTIIAGNRNESDCIKDGLTCHEECSMQGCWGHGPGQCVSCKNAVLDNVCATNCNGTRVYQIGYRKCKRCSEEDHYFEADSQQCGQCDPQCRGCRGPGPNNCIKCRNFKLFANANDIKNQSASFTCVDECRTNHPIKQHCVHKSVELDPEPSVVDEFVIVDAKAISDYQPYHDELNGVCKGPNSDSCKACKHVRNSLADFLKPFPKYGRVRSDS